MPRDQGPQRPGNLGSAGTVSQSPAVRSGASMKPGGWWDAGGLGSLGGAGRGTRELGKIRDLGGLGPDQPMEQEIGKSTGTLWGQPHTCPLGPPPTGAGTPE